MGDPAQFRAMQGLGDSMGGCNGYIISRSRSYFQQRRYGRGVVPSSTYGLPSTFLKKDLGVKVRNEIELTIGHGRLKVNNR